MTDLDVAVFKARSVGRVATSLGVPDEFIDTEEQLNRIRNGDPESFSLLTCFFVAYDEWFNLSKVMAAAENQFGMDHQPEFMQKVAALDKARGNLIRHLAT